MRKYISFFVISFVLFSCASTGSETRQRDILAEIRPLNPATEGAVKQLSYYLPALRGSPGDTPVYLLDSGNPGPSMLLVAGAHGREISGIYAAKFFVENARIESGRVFVIPYLNIIGVRNGVRLIPLQYQGRADPNRYVPPGGTTEFAGHEQRNINRAFPGSLDMGLAQKIALAVMNLLVYENIDIAIDMHEAPPTSPLAWMIISHPDNVHVAAMAALDMDDNGMPMRLDVSSGNEGLSHWEWGNRTGAMAFLTETANPAQSANQLQEEWDNPLHRLDWRVKVQLEAIRLLVYHSNFELPLPLIYSMVSQ